MKKIALVLATVVAVTAIQAQDTLSPVTVAPAGVVKTPASPNLKTVNLKNRPGDHLMLQFGYDAWTGMPDSIASHQKGFNRGFNAYFMFDKVFKSAPKMSFGIGAGVSTSNVFFKKMGIELNSKEPTLPFIALDSTNHFKKYKVSTAFLEIPLELRYASRPANYNKSFKMALGLKLGTMVNAHTKGKNLVDKNEAPSNTYTEKIASRKFMNTTRFMATARVGYGIFTLYGAYGLSNLLKDGVGPEMKPIQVGITLSGL